MESTQNRTSKKELYWRYHIDRWRESGRSQKAYCSSNGLTLATFGYWKRKIDRPVLPQKTNFYPLIIPHNKAASMVPEAESCKLVLHVDKYRLEIAEGFASEHLIKVINTLELMP